MTQIRYRVQDLHDIDNHGKASILAQQATTISTPNDRGTYSPSMVDTECGNYGGPANNSQPLRDIFPGYAVFDTSDFFVQSDLILSTRDSYDESRESCTQYDMSQRLLPGSDSSLHSILQSELKKELVYSTDDPSHLSHSTLYNLSGQSTLEDASSQRGESDPTWMQENSGHRILPSFEHTDKQFPQTAYDLNVNDSILAITQGNDSNDAGTLGCESQSNNADISEWRLDGKALTVHSQSREDQRQSQHNEKGRRALDDFLIRSKLSGMSYKEIKLKGNFREAESTLRGRFRNLTKPRENRVRKPRWNERDVELLRIAVQDIATEPRTKFLLLKNDDDLDSSKISWKRVAKYVAEHGAYPFGNATCRKKWDEIISAEKGDQITTTEFDLS